MAKVTDLYALLKAYSAKNKSPNIEIDAFLDYLEKYAARKVHEQSEWEKWLGNKGVQFWSELSALVESDKCMLVEDDTGGKIYIPGYYVDMLQEIYRDPDKMADAPFPSEESLGVQIPDHQLKIYNLKTDMKLFLETADNPDAGNKENDKNPEQIIKLIFPEDSGSALLLHSMMPRVFLETAMLKIRNYLTTRRNKEYILHKLTPQFQGKESYLREILEQMVVRPIECLNSMEKSGDFPFIFWNHFCNLIRTDIKKRNETLSDEMAAIQSVYILEICNGYYRARAVKLREKEIAFRNLELCMAKPPYYFTKEEIVKFSTSKGVQLLGMYSTKELDDYIKKMTTESVNMALPEWLVINGKNGAQWYLKKEKYLSICVKMLGTTSPLIKKTITKRWVKMLKDYSGEAAMEKDADFEKMLGVFSATLNPELTAFLKDQKLQWVTEEIERTQGLLPSSLQLFKAGKLLPFSALYSIRRKDILSDAKILLPIRYTFPIISAIVAFFHRLSGKKGKKRKSESESINPESIDIEEAIDGKTKTIQDLYNIAETIKSELVPAGQTPEIYMSELESRWNNLIGAKERRNLIDDVQSLVRDNLRKMVRIHKTKKISRQKISESADNIIHGTPALHSLGNQEALRHYIELYMAKMLLNVK